LRVRALGSTLFSLVVLIAAAPAAAPARAAARAVAKVSGGTAAGSSAGASSASAPNAATVGGASTATGGAPVKPPVYTAPVTAHTASLLYSGPVYEKTTAGQIVPYVPPAPVGETNGPTGGVPAQLPPGSRPDLLVPGVTARWVNGLAAAPMSAPAAIQEIIWAGNQIIGLPYIYGGGHASFTSPGYDCSGTVSFALHGATLLSAPMDSSEFMSWGGHGIGQWVTIFSNPGHAYMTVAGLRLDTSSADDPTNQQGPRWRPLRPANHGFVRRHPVGL
jgi:hypothetical protein